MKKLAAGLSTFLLLMLPVYALIPAPDIDPAKTFSKEATTAISPSKLVSNESFEIISPGSKLSTYADAVLVSGNIMDPDVSEIMIGDDRIILLPEEASFSKLIPLAKGENLIEVKAISQSKTIIATKTLKITRN